MIDWLVNRSATCAGLRGDLSLVERQVECLRDDLGAARGDAEWFEMLYKIGHAIGEKRRTQMRALRRELDGCMRELIMERMRIDEMRADFARRYGELSESYERWRDFGVHEIMRDCTVCGPVKLCTSCAGEPETEAGPAAECCGVCKKSIRTGDVMVILQDGAVRRVFCGVACQIKFQGGTGEP